MRTAERRARRRALNGRPGWRVARHAALALVAVGAVASTVPLAFPVLAAGQGITASAVSRTADAPRAPGSRVPARGLAEPAAGYGPGGWRTTRIVSMLEEGHRLGVYPGATIVVGSSAGPLWSAGVGTQDWRAASPAADPGRTLYDLASLSKIVGTSTVVMALLERNQLHLQSTVRSLLPDAWAAPVGDATVRDLLLHRSGLPAGRDIWRVAHTPAEARVAVLSSKVFAPPGRYMEYSDLGMDVLGFVAEAAGGARLDVLVDSLLTRPAGMASLRYRPPTAWAPWAAPTELTPPRGYPLQGEVHDENAYALGGVAGHAGLFSSAVDLGRYGQMLLAGGTIDGRRILEPQTVACFLGISADAMPATDDEAEDASGVSDSENPCDDVAGIGPAGAAQLEQMGVAPPRRTGLLARIGLGTKPPADEVAGSAHRGLGWERCIAGATICGKSGASTTVYHTGYTGTFLAIDPVHDRYVVLLTNRVHAPKAPRSMRDLALVRASILDAVLADVPVATTTGLIATLRETARRAPPRHLTAHRKRRTHSRGAKRGTAGTSKGSAKARTTRRTSASHATTGRGATGAPKAAAAPSGRVKPGDRLARREVAARTSSAKHRAHSRSPAAREPARPE